MKKKINEKLKNVKTIFNTKLIGLYWLIRTNKNINLEKKSLLFKYFNHFFKY